MSLAALIRSMADAGAPPEAIALAVEALEARDAITEARKAKDRERKRKVRGMSVEIPETVQGNPETPSPPDGSPKIISNPSLIPPSKKTPGGRGSRLPDDWRLSEESFLFAQNAIGPARTSEEFLKFCDFWRGKPGQSGTKLDWPATWRNWVRSSVERQQQRGTGPPRGRKRTYGDLARELPLDPSHEPDYENHEQGHAAEHPYARNGGFNGRLPDEDRTRGGLVLDLRPEPAFDG